MHLASVLYWPLPGWCIPIQISHIRIHIHPNQNQNSGNLRTWYPYRAYLPTPANLAFHRHVGVLNAYIASVIEKRCVRAFFCLFPFLSAQDWGRSVHAFFPLLTYCSLLSFVIGHWGRSAH